MNRTVLGAPSPSGAERQGGSAERAATHVANRVDIDILPAGGDLRRGRRRRRRSFRHRVMRYFLGRQLGPNAVSVTGLPHRLEPSSAGLYPVGSSGTTERLTSLHRSTPGTQSLPTIATTTQANLDPAPLAAREPVLGRYQDAPCRRFLDMELEP